MISKHGLCKLAIVSVATILMLVNLISVYVNSFQKTLQLSGKMLLTYVTAFH
jgi:hypothetical protein